MKFDDRMLQERLHSYRDDFGNWRRWLLVTFGPGHCGSIEWQYLPERLTEAEEKLRREEKPPRIETLPAIWMEEIVAGMDETQRELLRLWWARMKSSEQCLRSLATRRILTFPARDFERELLRWSNFAFNRLQFRKKQHNLRTGKGLGRLPTVTGLMPVAASPEEIDL